MKAASIATIAAVLSLGAGAAHAQITNDTVKLGLLTDFSSIYADNSGKGNQLVTEMAIAEFGGKINGKPIELVTADFLNKLDVAMNIARKWIDEDKVDVIVDAPNSGIALAIAGLARDTDKVYLSGASSSDITGKACTPNSVHFPPDTYSYGAVAARSLVNQGKKTWFTLTVDYALGHSMERDALAIVEANGGKSLGAIRFPFNNQDFSSFLLQAQNSKAQVLAFATGGVDLRNAMKQAVEFGLNKNMSLVGLSVELLDSKAIGKEVMGGAYLTEAWYWDMNDETRAFAKAYFDKRQLMPSRTQVAMYSSVRHYLKAVQALGSDASGKAVVNKMKELPVNDIYAKNAKVREDGRLIRDMYVAQVKTPAESKGEWDLYKIVATVPADKAWRPAAESECPLLKKS